VETELCKSVVKTEEVWGGCFEFPFARNGRKTAIGRLLDSFSFVKKRYNTSERFGAFFVQPCDLRVRGHEMSGMYADGLLGTENIIPQNLCPVRSQIANGVLN